MSDLHVNLLKKNEQRRQSVVGRNFIITWSILTPLLFITLFVLVRLSQLSGVKVDLAATQSSWELMEPKLKRVNEQRAQLLDNKTEIALLSGWKSGRISLDEVLHVFRDSIAENVQVTHLSLSGASFKGVCTEVADVGQKFSLTMSGVAKGAESDTDASALTDQLNRNDVLMDIFDSIELKSSRKSERADEAIYYEFSLIGVAKSGASK